MKRMELYEGGPDLDRRVALIPPVIEIAVTMLPYQKSMIAIHSPQLHTGKIEDKIRKRYVEGDPDFAYWILSDKTIGSFAAYGHRISKLAKLIAEFLDGNTRADGSLPQLIYLGTGIEIDENGGLVKDGETLRIHEPESVNYFPSDTYLPTPSSLDKLKEAVKAEFEILQRLKRTSLLKKVS
ncbi:hypothetical protein HYV80_07590 [Candidatus Woesearchaeota archaeon]|nr:hypothetical protein [Candidatus Woesearchaeota archaeon]